MAAVRSFVRILAVLCLVAARLPADEPAAAENTIRVPEGYSLELAAGQPLVEHPMLAGFDDRGRLFVAESAGLNLRPPDLEAQLPNFVRMLEDTDGDGRFDRSTIFADRMTFPMGALWHNGALYVASPPNIWRLEDTNDDGVADKREVIVSKFGYNGNAADVHGCFLGPEGRLYWCDGRHGHEFRSPDGQIISQGKAARIFSCRPDGSDVRIHCGGGMDNPVEIDFTDEGEMLGTVNLLFAKRGDCIVHWMHGGVYPRYDQQQCLDEFRRTGDPLLPVLDVGHVAVSGMMRYRGTGLGAEFRDNLFYTEFNTHRIMRVVLERSGATFSGRSEEFLVAASNDFHPTDVLEDADGSLLVIDTGGWFRIGCPTSQVAKPEIAGAIYRVRKQGASPADDSRGLKIDFRALPAAELVRLLEDERFAVRERATTELVLRGGDAVAPLKEAWPSAGAQARVGAVWALCRIGSPEARAAVRVALTDEDLNVAQAAAYAAGALGDKEAITPLSTLVLEGAPPVRRQAATALGQIGDGAAVPALLDALKSAGDRVLEHALIYALIEIGDRDATQAGLAAPVADVRRGALIALDQMPEGNLTREQVTPLLDTGNVALQRAALEAITRRPGWADEIIGLVRGWLSQPQLSPEQLGMLRGALLAFQEDETVQQLVADALATGGTPARARLVLLEAIARNQLKEVPAAWLTQLGRQLHSDDPQVLRQAVTTAASLNVDGFDGRLRALAADAKQPLGLRLAALGGVANHGGALDATGFDFLVLQLGDQTPPIDRLAAAMALGRAALSSAQLASLVRAVRQAGPLEMPALATAYEKAQDAALGLQLVAALREAPGTGNLPPARLQQLLAHFPEDVRAAAEPLLKQFAAGAQQQAARLEELRGALEGGDAQRGRQVFVGRRAGCTACHRIGGEGGVIGPDLSAIGKIRAPRDLLEAIVLPSASLARGFESYAVACDDGRVLSGVMVRETADAIYLHTAQREEIRIGRNQIDQIAPSPVSIMPQGLEKTMTGGDLADLIAYLASLGR